MGLCIALQTESGEQIELIADEKNLLDKLLGYPDASIFPMLASIDRHGDTDLQSDADGSFSARMEHSL
jgi:hypothetical protein